MPPRSTRQSNAQVRIWWDTSVQAYRLTSTYSSELVDLLKTSIPASDRSFDFATKIWTFTERWLTPLSALLKTIGAQTTVISRQQAEAAVGTGHQGATDTNAVGRVSLDDTAAQFIRLLPFDAAQTAYRKAALALHPDHGGSMEKMQTLNVLWQRLEKELYNQ